MCVCVRMCVSPPRLNVSRSVRKMDARVPFPLLWSHVFLSPQQSSSAPTYYDVVPVFSQSIAFSGTGARWPNWKELRPPFHQSHRRAQCRAHRALGGMKEMCGVSHSEAWSLTTPLFPSPPTTWRLRKHFTGNKDACSRWWQKEKNTSQRKVSWFCWLCLLIFRQDVYIRVPSLFKSASSVLWRTENEHSCRSNETFLCRFALMKKHHSDVVSACYIKRRSKYIFWKSVSMTQQLRHSLMSKDILTRTTCK